MRYATSEIAKVDARCCSVVGVSPPLVHSAATDFALRSVVDVVVHSKLHGKRHCKGES